MLKGIKSYKITYTKPSNIEINKDKLIYTLPNVFSMKLQGNYLWSFIMIPITGTFDLTATLTDAKYTINVNNTNIVPELNGVLTIELGEFTNIFANALGIKNQLEHAKETIKNHILEYVIKVFDQEGREYYEGFFGDTNYLISFPGLRKYTISRRLKVKKFELEGKTLVTNYDVVSKTRLNTIDGEFIKCTNFSMKEVYRIMSIGTGAIRNIILTEEMIPKTSHFHLNRMSLSRVLSEIVHEPEGTKAMIIFDSNQSTIIGDYSPKINLK